jgi:hypothetical protein
VIDSESYSVMEQYLHTDLMDDKECSFTVESHLVAENVNMGYTL